MLIFFLKLTDQKGSEVSFSFYSFLFLMIIYFNNSFLMNMLLISKSKENFFLLLLILLVLIIIFFMKDNYFNYLNLLMIFWFCLIFFMTMNMFLFYFCFEFSLIPIIMMMLLKGYQIEKLEASNYFIFYSIFFSLPFLLTIFIYNLSFMNIYIKFKINIFLFFYMVLLFLMKIPLFMFHFWLPKVHVEASTPSSMILAGLLLKLGTFGLSLMLKMTLKFFFILVMILSLIGLSLINILTIFQSDMKAFLAFSSIVHMNFLIMNLLILMKLSKFSSFIMMMSHGFISTILFFLIGEIYSLNMFRLFYFMKSLFFNNYKFFIFWLVFFLFNMGLPLNFSFFSEFLGFISFFSWSKFLMIFIFIYFLYSFFYTIFMLLNNYLGKNKTFFKEKSNILMFLFFIYSINFLIFFY